MAKSKPEVKPSSEEKPSAETPKPAAAASPEPKKPPQKPEGPQSVELRGSLGNNVTRVPSPAESPKKAPTRSVPKETAPTKGQNET